MRFKTIKNKTKIKRTRNDFILSKKLLDLLYILYFESAADELRILIGFLGFFFCFFAY